MNLHEVCTLGVNINTCIKYSITYRCFYTSLLPYHTGSYTSEAEAQTYFSKFKVLHVYQHMTPKLGHPMQGFIHILCWGRGEGGESFFRIANVLYAFRKQLS